MMIQNENYAAIKRKICKFQNRVYGKYMANTIRTVKKYMNQNQIK